MRRRAQKSKCCCLLAAAFIVLGMAGTMSAEVHVCTPESAASNIAEIVARSSAGDTIIVQGGHYPDQSLTIDKPLTIIGRDWPVLAGSDSGNVVTITASDVSLSGLVISGAPVSFVDDNAGLLLERVSNVTVRNCRFENNFFAIYLAEAADCVIRENTVAGHATTESRSGNGIHLWSCRDVVVENNTVRGHRDGIYFEFVKYSEIRENLSRDNLRYGLHFMFSDTCRYEANTFEKNGAGVAVMYTHFVTMANNTFKDNWGASAFGLLLKELTDSKVTGNSFYRNSVGVYVEGCNRVKIDSNEFIDNGWAIELMANSIDNRFTRNAFSGNSFTVATNSRQNFNTFRSNYWSDYSGYDLDDDGYGDVPHRPVTLFSMIVQKNPPTLVMLHSLTVDVLNLAERVMPSLTPATLMDAQPLMEPLL